MPRLARLELHLAEPGLSLQPVALRDALAQLPQQPLSPMLNSPRRHSLRVVTHSKPALAQSEFRLPKILQEARPACSLRLRSQCAKLTGTGGTAQTPHHSKASGADSVPHSLRVRSLRPRSYSSKGQTRERHSFLRRCTPARRFLPGRTPP